MISNEFKTFQMSSHIFACIRVHSNCKVLELISIVTTQIPLPSTPPPFVFSPIPPVQRGGAFGRPCLRPPRQHCLRGGSRLRSLPQRGLLLHRLSLWSPGPEPHLNLQPTNDSVLVSSLLHCLGDRISVPVSCLCLLWGAWRVPKF